VTFAAGHIFGNEFAKDPDTADLITTMAKGNPIYATMTPLEAGQALLGSQMSLILLLLPVILPSIISSYSIVGEKTSRTLEPLLATPITTSELLVAKSLTALIPAVVATWFGAVIFVVGIWLSAVSDKVFQAIITPGWLIALVVATPLLGLITVSLTVAVSSKVNDPRTAQQVSVVMILPIMLIFFGQFTGLLVFNAVSALVGSAVLAVICVILIAIEARVFQRETILTNWT
jgi:ABC-2 type transport system permease protein